MAIKPINTINFEQKQLSKTKPAKDNLNSPEVVQTENYNPAFLGKSKVFVDQLNALKNEIKGFSKDINYRKGLMLNAGKSPEEYYKLRSIVGSEEIKSIMKDFNANEEFYSVGVNDINIKNKTIRANLHIHTIASDGALSVEELLDKAAAYANKVAKKEAKHAPFTIAITDHDTTESAKEAIKIISEDPLKYKNLRVILGAEITTYNNIATDFVNHATNTHVLVYGIDPNEKSFESFIEKTKQDKSKIAQKIIKEANLVYKKVFNREDNLFSIKQAKELFNPLNKNILGIYNYMEKYLETKFVLSEIILKNPKLVEKIAQKDLPQSADTLLDEIKNFYYLIDKNNKPRSAMESIPDFLSSKLGLPQEEIKKIIQDGLKTDHLTNFKNELNADLEQYKRTLTPKYNYMPTLESLFEVVKDKESIIIGLAHPLETAAKIKNPMQKQAFLVDLYTQFKNACKEKAGFSEVYYQSYTNNLQIIKNDPEIQKFFESLSNKLGLFKTGSADTHNTNIFKR